MPPMAAPKWPRTGAFVLPISRLTHSWALTMMSPRNAPAMDIMIEGMRNIGEKVTTANILSSKYMVTWKRYSIIRETWLSTIQDG